MSTPASPTASQQLPGSRPFPIATDVLASVEKDAQDAAKNVMNLLDSLRSSLTASTQGSQAHMEVHYEAAESVQQAAAEAATKGNRFVNECLRLNEEMRDVSELAAKVSKVKAALNLFEQHANKYLKP